MRRTVADRTDPAASAIEVLERRLRAAEERADNLAHQVEQYEQLVPRLQRALRTLRELYGDAEREPGVPRGHYRVTLTSEAGALTPQTLTADTIREALLKAQVIPWSRWQRDDVVDVPAS